MNLGFVAIGAFLGLIFGSFATVAAYRVPRRTGLNGRSKCPECGHMITPAENIPVLSYLMQRGRCRHCGCRIPVRYPLIELLTAILFALAALKFGPSLRAAVYAAFFWVLVLLSVIDLEHRLLPDRVVFPALAAGVLLLSADAATEGGFGRLSGVVVASAAAVGALLWALWPRRGDDRETHDDPISWPIGFGLVVAWIALVSFGIIDGTQKSISGALVGAAVFAGFFLTVALLISRGMGGGDVKLGLLLGTFLGYLGAPGLVLFAMFMAFLLGSLVSVAVLLAGGNRKSAIPFGPILSLGAVASVLVGERVIDIYLGLGAG